MHSVWERFLERHQKRQILCFCRILSLPPGSAFENVVKKRQLMFPLDPVRSIWERLWEHYQQTQIQCFRRIQSIPSGSALENVVEKDN